MNKNRLLQSWHIGCTLLAALFMASCSQDEALEQGTQGEPLPAGKYPLELTASGLEVVATPAEASTRGTFFDNDWKGVTGVNVRVNGQVKEYKVTPESQEDYNTVTLEPAKPLTTADADKDFWWNSTGETKTVLAWAPTSIGYNTVFTLPEVWTDEEFAKYDVIGVRKDIGFTDTSKSLEFQHLLAKVVVNLRRTDYLENAKEIKVQLIEGYVISGSLVFYDNQLSVQSDYSLYREYTTAYRLPKVADEPVNFGGNVSETPFVSYTALTIPKNSGNSSILQIEVDGVAYTVTLESIGRPGYAVFYRAGQVTTFNITVKEEGLDYATVEYSMKWDENGATGDGSVAIP